MGLESKKSIDYADSDLTRTLDEAFAKGPPSRANNRSFTGGRASKSPQGETSVNSHGSQDRRGGTSAAGGAGGVARERSQRRASIAAAVTMVASATAATVDEHVHTSRIERPRERRRSKTHEDRFAAAALIDMGQGSGGGSRNRNTRQIEDREEEEFDEDFSDAGSEDVDVPVERTKARGGRRHIRRPSNNSDSNDQGETTTPTRERRTRRHHSDPDCEYGDQGDSGRDTARRSRFATKPSARSFDDSMGNMRARGRRRASMMGGSAASETTDDSQGNTFRARRTRRASACGDSVGIERSGQLVGRAEPVTRGVRESLSGRRARRATMATSGIEPVDDGIRSDHHAAAAFDDFNSLDQSQEDQFVDQERGARANKQNALLERLRKAKEEKQQIVDEGSLDDGIEKPPEPEPEEQKQPRSRRRASLGFPAKFGLSSTNFASVEEGDSKRDRRAEKGVSEKTAKPERTGKTPARAKSTDGGVPAGQVGRSRAADTDRRRRGTMMDRIGG